jgi:CheY-like chemotaxis protein
MTRASPLVMLVDDDEDIRDVLRLFLEIDGYRVTTATDGLDALEQLKNTCERPSLILLDLMMPRMDGEQFMKTLRASPFADIPVVIMSGYREAGDKTRQLNGNCCLMKPVEFDQLMAVVHRFAKT